MITQDDFESMARKAAAMENAAHVVNEAYISEQKRLEEADQIINDFLQMVFNLECYGTPLQDFTQTQPYVGRAPAIELIRRARRWVKDE